MGSSGTVRFKDLVEMLRHCAPAATIHLKLHFRWVLFAGLIYRTLPKQDEIELGHVRKMIRFLGIDLECAKKKLPVLGPPAKTKEQKSV